MNRKMNLQQLKKMLMMS